MKISKLGEGCIVVSSICDSSLVVKMIKGNVHVCAYVPSSKMVVWLECGFSCGLGLRRT